MTTLPPFTRRARLALGPASIFAVAILAVAACGPEPSSPTPEPAAFDGRLLVHAGRPESSQLFALDGRGVETDVALPAGGLRWFAAGADGQLAGVDAEGRIVVADGSGASWRAVSTSEVPVEARAADIKLPAWSPDGRLAVLWGDSATATSIGVLVVDPATDGELWLDLAAGLGGYAPAWLDASRLAAPTRGAQDEPTMTILDVDAGSTELAARGARAVAASPDGSTLAVLLPDSRTVELWRPATWLGAPDEGPLGRAKVPEGSIVEALALDRTGDHLALASVASDDTTDGLVAVHDGLDGWALALERPIAAGSPIGSLGFVP